MKNLKNALLEKDLIDILSQKKNRLHDSCRTLMRQFEMHQKKRIFPNEFFYLYLHRIYLRI